MKWFVGLFLLFTFTLLSEYGVYANWPGKYNGNAEIKFTQNTTGNYHIHNSNEFKINRSVPGVSRTEYRKIRGTNEEDDDEENTFVLKKTRLLKSNNLKSDFTNFAMSAPQRSSEDYRYTITNSTSSSFSFFSKDNRKRYSLLQVFKI